MKPTLLTPCPLHCTLSDLLFTMLHVYPNVYWTSVNARCCAVCFTSTFNPPKSCMIATANIPIWDMGRQDEMTCNLPRVIQFISGRSRMQTQAVLAPEPVLTHPTIPPIRCTVLQLNAFSSCYFLHQKHEYILSSLKSILSVTSSMKPFLEFTYVLLVVVIFRFPLSLVFILQAVPRHSDFFTINT